MSSIKSRVDALLISIKRNKISDAHGQSTFLFTLKEEKLLTPAHQTRVQKDGAEFLLPAAVLVGI